MNRARRLSWALGLLGVWVFPLIALAADERASEESITMKSLPAPVRKTAEEQSKGAVVRGISKETDGDSTVYEVELKVDGHTKDIIIGADGTLLISEEEVSLARVPASVRTTIVKGAGKGRVLLVETVTKAGEFAYYEAQVRSGKKRWEIKVDSDGNLVPEEKK